MNGIRKFGVNLCKANVAIIKVLVGVYLLKVNTENTRTIYVKSVQI